jgi:hypothetical protein
MLPLLVVTRAYRIGGIVVNKNAVLIFVMHGSDENATLNPPLRQAR